MTWLVALTVGAIGYGASLVLYVLALRHLGTARTAAHFGTAPFFGAALAVAFLGEPLERDSRAGVRADGRCDLACADRAGTATRTITKRWSTSTATCTMSITSTRIAATKVPEPHSHPHRHAPLRHRHAHFPDLHHRHRH